LHQYYFATKLPSKILIREKLRKILLNNKSGRKILMKLRTAKTSTLLLVPHILASVLLTKTSIIGIAATTFAEEVIVILRRQNCSYKEEPQTP
jgi:hypothetical protein